MPNIVGILVPLQRSKEVHLDIALAVKMLNLPAVIIVLSVTDVCLKWTITAFG